MLRTASGLADDHGNESLTPSSAFYVGSLAKQFTAACILLLELDGLLDIGDPVSHFLPGLPQWGEEVTISHVLHQTTGLVATPSETMSEMGPSEELADFVSTRRSAFPPGTRHEYSAGYCVLAEIVRSVSEQSLAMFAAERIFEPLGMRRTMFRDARGQEVPRAVRGHPHASDARPQNLDPTSNYFGVGDGGLWTTTEDLERWDANFYEDRLAQGRLSAQLRIRGTLTSGRKIHYARGISIRTHHGLRIESHSGGFPGWSAKMLRFPAQSWTIIWLANSSAIDTHALAMKTADILLREQMDFSAPDADETLHLEA